MTASLPHVKAAVVQAAPVLFDRDACVEKVHRLTLEAATQGAQLVLFPEAFIPAYPRGLSFGTVVGSRSPAGRLTWERYWANSVDVPGPPTEALGEAAHEAGVYLAVGVTERDSQYSRGTLYCTLLYFGPDGRLLGKHRKLKPTGAERLIWGEGDGSTLTVVETEFGRVGGLICWENYMPLARQALYAWGTQILVSPTWDRGDMWQATLRHIGKEGGLYVIGCCQALHLRDIPDRYEFKQLYPEGTEWINSGGSCIVDPRGSFAAGPVHDGEEILYAEINPKLQLASKRLFDVAGHYARSDVFQLTVNRSRN